MSCREVDLLLMTRGPVQRPPLISAHLEACDRCRKLVELMEETRPAPTPDAAHVQRIRTRLVQGLTPVRPVSSPSLLAVQFALLSLAVFASGCLLLGTAGWQARDSTQRVLEFTPLAAAAALLAVAMARQVVPAGPPRLSPALMAAGSFGTFGLAIAAAFESHAEAGFYSGGLPCLRRGTVVAASAALVLGWSLRNGARISPILAATVTGGLAGISSLALLEAQCPNVNTQHILVWHALVVVAAAGAGALTGAAISRPRQSSS